ncbi:MAG: HAD family hydrolase [Candidatus Atribacteria bacterium]|nr:MAG: HAD family hydrolase [Candidatus Atribacteria bacterium]
MTQQFTPADVLLIFDLDGTLNQTEATFLPTMKAAFAQHGIPYVGDTTILKQVGETFPDFLRWLAGQGFPDDTDALAAEISRYEFESIAASGELYPQVEEILRDLKKRGFLLAICTNGDLAYTRAVLGKFDLFDLFDGIKTFGDSQQTKTEMIAELLGQFSPTRSFMIGDRYHDFIAGRANGCTVVATTYGFAADGEADEADVCIDRFGDLPAVVSRFAPLGYS